jgi:CheY-like chemotaxis protein
MLREVEQAAERAAELTQQMLAYSGKGKFQIQSLRLDALVQEMAKLLKSVVSRKVSLDLKLESASIEGDPTQLRQVVMNLIINASDAMEGKVGTIRVRTGMVYASAADLLSPYLPEELPPGDYAFLEVEDSGCGMSAETQAKIFDPFFTTKFTGRGLGLAAVLGIVRAHRGTIKVTSTMGEGTHFQMLFPCVSSQPEAPAETDSRPVPQHGKGLVLVIDDEAAINHFIHLVLKNAGFEVLTAEDGREGLKLLRENSPQLVAVLLDLTMPRMDGLEVMRELRHVTPLVPVLVMSGYSEQEISVRCAGIGANGFIQKPFNPRSLIAALSGVVTSSETTPDHG